ncbi:hypothetical protein NDU88_007738 [Pleurodeles waltl]|uniref:Uncharacterized protein n=1 Tax=Pleurodeles waltl TaxID=8319 RepID=A0AAV7STL4_PLEWA|nr:hypothetical protein NDU88_007738 [Pleurodeles waltl]
MFIFCKPTYSIPIGPLTGDMHMVMIGKTPAVSSNINEEAEACPIEHDDEDSEIKRSLNIITVMADINPTIIPNIKEEQKYCSVDGQETEMKGRTNNPVDKNIPSLEYMKDKVGGSQAKAKSRYEEIKRVKDIVFNVGDRVRVRRTLKLKGSKYFQETKVVQVFMHSVRVEDGKWWSKRKVAIVGKGVDRVADMLIFQTHDKGFVDYESGVRDASDLQEGRMFYEPGVLDGEDVVVRYAGRDTCRTLDSQDEIQDSVQDGSLNRCLSKRACIKPKYLDDYVFK